MKRGIKQRKSILSAAVVLVAWIIDYIGLFDLLQDHFIKKTVLLSFADLLVRRVVKNFFLQELLSKSL